MRNGVVILLALAGLAWAGVHYRAPLLALVNPPASSAHPAEKPDVLYSWVDKNGVTHYEQESGRGARVAYDGRRITRLEPIPAEVLAQSKARAEAEAEAAKPKGSQTLHELRKDLPRNPPEAQAGSGDL